MIPNSMYKSYPITLVENMLSVDQNTELHRKKQPKNDRNRVSGRIGGIQTFMRYGRSHMQSISLRGGRPSRRKAADKAWLDAGQGSSS